jgi:hypothetical protein
MSLEESLKIAKGLKFWQILLSLGIAAPLASHYGWGIDINYSILIALALIAVACLVRYFPPPEPKPTDEPKVAISAAQTAFCAQFEAWTDFDSATMAIGPEDDLKPTGLKIKCKQLRLELATLQGLLDREIVAGKHLVRFHLADDETTFIPSGD